MKCINKKILTYPDKWLIYNVFTTSIREYNVNHIFIISKSQFEAYFIAFSAN